MHVCEPCTNQHPRLYNSIPDLVLIYYLHLGRGNGYTPLWSLRGLCMYLLCVCSGVCDHLLYVQYVLVTFVHLSLREFKDLAITSCLLNIIPPLKKKKSYMN